MEFRYRKEGEMVQTVLIVIALDEVQMFSVNFQASADDFDAFRDAFDTIARSVALQAGGRAPRPASPSGKGSSVTKITPNYVEMKAADLSESKAFYETAFGFSFTDYGPQYAAVEGGPMQIGLLVGPEPAAPMPTFESDDLESTLAAVRAAGGRVEKEIFAFPGGRRFECLDPAGNRIAIYQAD